MISKTFSCVFVFSALIGFAYCQNTLLCYACNPLNPLECSDPVAHDVASSPCSPVNGTSLCVTAYIEAKNQKNKTGIYRGCQTLRSDVRDFCDWYKEEQSSVNFTIVSCIACNSTRCNTAILKPDGTNGAGNTINTFLMICLNTLLFFFINSLR